MGNAEVNEEFYQQETEQLRKALSEAVDLILNTKTGQIGPFCRAAAERWQRLLDSVPDRPPNTLRCDPASDLPRVNEIPQGYFYCRGCQSVVRMRHLCPGRRRLG